MLSQQLIDWLNYELEHFQVLHFIALCQDFSSENFLGMGIIVRLVSLPASGEQVASPHEVLCSLHHAPIFRVIFQI